MHNNRIDGILLLGVIKVPSVGAGWALSCKDRFEGSIMAKTKLNTDGGIAALSEASSQLSGALRSFAAALAQSEVPRNAQELLPKVLEFADRVQLNRGAIADACQVSEATVSRWASGRVKPHVIIARVAIEAIQRLANQKASEYEQETELRYGCAEKTHS